MAEGDRFDVGQVQEVVDEDTGEVLDSDMTKIATLEVTSVKEKIAYCMQGCRRRRGPERNDGNAGQITERIFIIYSIS